MICSVCQTENDHLAVVCTKCGGYLQTKIDHLDLFATSWGIVERPRATFHMIAIAQHKNYGIILSALWGFAFAFFLFWYVNAGDYTDSLINIIGAGIFTGPMLGVLTVLIYSGIMKIAAAAVNAKGTYWQIYAIASYALIPVIASAVLFLPIELMTFGLYFFTKNPSPYLLKPASYVLLTGLDAAFALWTLILLWIGWSTLFRTPWWKTLIVMAVSTGILAAGIHLAATFFFTRE